jgi:tRNA(Ile)-lysidine synthetase-like protein
VLLLRSGYQPEVPIGHFNYCVEVPGEIEIPDLGLSIKTKLGKTQDEHGISQADAERQLFSQSKVASAKNRHQASFDYDKIHGDLHLRNRRSGDRFQPLGMSGTKKLKDFFIDEKIPRVLRDSIPVLTDGNDILWIIGYRIDGRFKITSDTKTQLEVTVTPKQTSERL